MRACFIEKMTIWSPRLCPVENSIKRARTKEGFIWITTSREQLWTFYRVKWNFGRTGRFVGASSYYGLKMARTWLIVRIIYVKTDSISVFFVLPSDFWSRWCLKSQRLVDAGCTVCSELNSVYPWVSQTSRSLVAVWLS